MILSTVQSRETPEHPTNYCLGMASTGDTNQRRMLSRSLRGDSMLGRGLVSTRRSTRAEGSSLPLSAYDSKTYCRLVATYESGLKQTMRELWLTRSTRKSSILNRASSCRTEPLWRGNCALWRLRCH